MPETRRNPGRSEFVPSGEAASLHVAPSAGSPLRATDVLPALLTVVVPTFNEARNVPEIVNRLNSVLEGVAWEVVFVDDDSPDGTAEIVRGLAAIDARVRCLKRVGRRGLAGACVEGMLSSSAAFVAVIDGDLQHDEHVLPRMLSLLEAGSADLVVGSRYVPGGSADAFAASRAHFSHAATRLAQSLLGVSLSDPMSGFFMLRRDRLDGIVKRLSPVGFKILLDIVLTSKGRLRIAELPYEFRERVHGDSKFDTQIGLEFLGLVLGKMTGGVVDPRFLSFALVGATGLAVHLVALRLAFGTFALDFSLSQAVATFVAMVSNFFLNNALTYHDRRLSGVRLIRGFLGFCLISAAGAIANVGLAAWLYSEQPTWWLAGAAGAIMGALWNYSMSSQYVWRTR